MALLTESSPTWLAYELASKRHVEVGFQEPNDTGAYCQAAAELVDTMDCHMAYCATNGKWAPSWFPGVLTAHRNWVVGNRARVGGVLRP